MTTAARVGGWLSKSRWRVYLLLLPLMVLPISFFAYSVGALLRQQAQQQAATESTQIARVSATLVEEHFRQSTAFLESIATRRKFLQSWKERNLDEVGWHLDSALSMTGGISAAWRWTPETRCSGESAPRRESQKHGQFVCFQWPPAVGPVV